MRGKERIYYNTRNIVIMSVKPAARDLKFNSRQV